MLKKNVLFPFLTLQVSSKKEFKRRTVITGLTAPSTLWGTAGPWSITLPPMQGLEAALCAANVFNLFISYLIHEFEWLSCVSLLFYCFSDSVLCFCPQRHHWAHQQGAVPGGRRRCSRDRGQALNPQNQQAGRWRPSEGDSDPADGDAANHERSDDYWH